jgi:hypothetical protein
MALDDCGHPPVSLCILATEARVYAGAVRIFAADHVKDEHIIAALARFLGLRGCGHEEKGGYCQRRCEAASDGKVEGSHPRQ